MNKKTATKSLPPLTRALKGILKTTVPIGKKDYDEYPEKKSDNPQHNL
jgi:hypothetical protein